MEEDQFNFDFSLEDFSFDEEYENQHEEEILEQDDDTEKDNSVENDEHSEEVDGEDNEEEDDDNDSDDDADNDDSSSDIYSSLALFAQERGILSSSLELSKDKIKSPEDLANLLNEEAEARALQKLEEKISSIDLEKIAQIRHEINDVSSLTEENFKNDIDLAKRIVEQDLQNQKLPERVIKN